MKFHQNIADYTVSASQDSVTASQNNNGATIFHRFDLRVPNKPYVVLKSTSGKNLYLSSDGAGNLKLKSWNLPKRSPPGASKYVDPAFLFRLVKT
ncbi:Hypothetical predicted protein [Paramuricea clavata]|uniref:Uncharacterized protein n=2 Tax=Paramuricea clavata TaxID=317549 RepID=A0A6S7JNJ3_PARCT|nr:Hypothetical predicted protein [Paramuricea clavata]